MRQHVLQKTVAVLGASGATGRLVIAEALARGHRVVAVVRRPGAFEPAPALREAVWSDVTDGAALAPALSGGDVVVSALGGAAKGPTSVCADSMAALLLAMAGAGVRRLVAVSAHGVLETHDRSLYARAVWAGVGERMKDKEAMEALITASDTEWTIVRPPALKNSAATGRYRTGDSLAIRLWHSVGRADLAQFLVREAEDARYVGRYPRIRR